MNWLWIKISVLSVVTLIILGLTVYLLIKSSNMPGLCNSGCENPIFNSIALGDNKLSNNEFETIAMGIKSNVATRDTHNIDIYRVGNKVSIIVPYYTTTTTKKGKYSFVKIPQEHLPTQDISFAIPLRIGVGQLTMGFAAITVATGEITIYYSENGQAVDFPIGKIGNDTFCMTYIV